MSKMEFTEKQKEAIFSEGKNILVSAGAGSGKTAVLTERILEKLKKGISLDELIILTFTNAAAFEMKIRIKKKIEKEVKNGNQSLLKELSKVDSALICTFDSFALYLVKKYHYLLNMDPNIQMGDTILMEHAKREKIEDVFTSHYEKKDPSFLSFIDTFSMKDDKKLKNRILSFYQKLDVVVNKKVFLENYFSVYLNEEKIEEYIKEYEKNIEEIYNNLLDEIEAMSTFITEDTKSFYDKLSALFKKIPKNYTYDDFTYITTFKLPILRKKEGMLYEKEITNLYEKIKDDFTKAKEYLNYPNKETIKEELNSTKETVNLLLSLLKELDEKMWKFKKENQVFTFSDITFLAITLLEENPSIQNEIKLKTKEIMVDEYQDTNDINEYFISLIANNNLYMVGDVKQSIYGFRNANPSLFMEKYEKYKEEIEGIKIDLTNNFRSKKEVLDAINTIFERVMDLEIGGADYKNGHQMIAGSSTQKKEKEINHKLEILDYSFVDSTYRKEEIEAFLIGHDILKKIKEGSTIFDKDKNIQRPLTFSDFTILMDRKTDFDLYKKIFTYLNIPVFLNIDEKFIASDEMYVLKNILKILNLYKEHNYYDVAFTHPFLSIARSFLFSYTDEEIMKAFLKAKNENITFYKAVREMEIFKDFSIKMDKVYEKVNELTLSSLLYEIYITFDFYNKINTKENVSFTSTKLDYLQDVAYNLEKMGYGIEEMLTYFEDAIEYKNDIAFSINKKGSDGVTITNIHKSKGLEYPICYYSGLSKNFSKEDFKDKFLFDKKYGFIVPIFKEGIKETILKTLFKKSYLKKDKAEKIRLFYVALTRAREKMIVVSNLEDSEKEEIKEGTIDKHVRLSYNSFYNILESIKGDLKPYIEKVDISCTGITNAYRRKEKDISYDKIPKTDKIVDFVKIKEEKIPKIKKSYSSLTSILDKDTKKKMEEGTNLHHYLEVIDFNHVKEDFKTYEVPSFYQNLIVRFLDSPIFEKKTIQNIYKEYAFFDEKTDKQGIIDLLVETKDGFLIIDYKLKEIEKESYQRQVEGYMEYIHTITGKKVKGYLYSLFDGTYKEINKKELVYE